MIPLFANFPTCLKAFSRIRHSLSVEILALRQQSEVLKWRNIDRHILSHGSAEIDAALIKFSLSGYPDNAVASKIGGDPRNSTRIKILIKEFLAIGGLRYHSFNER